MNRTSGVMAVMAVLVGYAALVGLGVVVFQQQTELQSIDTRLAQLGARSPSPALSPSPASNPSPAFAQLQKVTDNHGHTWLYCPCNGTANVLESTNFTFTAIAQDPLNRPIEYAYTVGLAPSETMLCNWGGAICSWTAPAAPVPIVVTVYIRAKNAPHLSSPCGILDSCDASLHLEFLLGT